MSEPSIRFDRLYSENLPAILGYALRRCTDPGDAADIAAEVFLTLWRRLDHVPHGDERLWLFGVARRVLANHRRGHVRRSDLADRLRSDLRTRPPVAEDAPTVVAEAMARLPQQDREVLALIVWDGLTSAEIAALEGVPAATVRSRLLRARTRLRNAMQEAPSEPAPAAVVPRRSVPLPHRGLSS